MCYRTNLKVVVVAVFLSTFALYASGQLKFITADNPGIRYEGRIDFSNLLKPCFMYSGVSIHIDFRGTSVAMVMKSDSSLNFFNIIIDGQIRVIHTTQRDTVYQLADSLRNQWHHLTIFRRTEWHGGNSHFIGLYLSHYASLRRPVLPQRELEFIGNSITCAYGNEGASNKEHFKYETENNYLSYAAITARQLKSQYWAICRSGIGLYTGRGDTTFAMPKLYYQICKGCVARPGKDIYRPDAIVIELGNNDFAVQPDSARFVGTYIKFLKTLRKDNPETHIICVAGPYNGGAGLKWAQFQNFVQATVKAANNADKKVYYFSFGTIYPNGSDWHPSAQQHQELADILVPFIKKVTKWE